MEIYNENMELIENPDLSKGWLKASVRTVHHDAVSGVREEGHFKVIVEYPNGGKDVEWIVDVPGVEAKDAWDEEIPIQVYVPYTQEQLDAMEAEKNKPTTASRVAALEEAIHAIEEGIASV